MFGTPLTGRQRRGRARPRVNQPPPALTPVSGPARGVSPAPPGPALVPLVPLGRAWSGARGGRGQGPGLIRAQCQQGVYRLAQRGLGPGLGG